MEGASRASHHDLKMMLSNHLSTRRYTLRDILSLGQPRMEVFFSVFPRYPDRVGLGPETLPGQQPRRRCLFTGERARGQPAAAWSCSSSQEPRLLRQRFTGLPVPQDPTWCFCTLALATQPSWGLVFAAETETTEPGRCQPCLYTDLRVK